MKILAITACTAGIAHTYIAKEKLENAQIGKPLRCSGLTGLSLFFFHEKQL